MEQGDMNRICSALPGAESSQPFGPERDVWKIGGKIFAIVGDGLISVKTPDIETAAMLIEAGVGQRAAYLHRSWISLPGDCDAQELSHRVCQSWTIIRAMLTKKLQAEIGELPDPSL